MKKNQVNEAVATFIERSSGNPDHKHFMVGVAVVFDDKHQIVEIHNPQEFVYWGYHNRCLCEVPVSMDDWCWRKKRCVRKLTNELIRQFGY